MADLRGMIGAKTATVETREYTPPGSLVGYLTSDQFINLVSGPVGCVSGETEFLTPHGWVPIAAYSADAHPQIAQWNAATGQAEFVTPTRYIKAPCEQLLHFHHREGLSQVLSAEHRVVYRLRRKGDKIHEKTALEVAQWHWRNGADMIRIPVTFAAPRTMGLPLDEHQLRLAVAVQAAGYAPAGRKAVTMNLKKARKKARLKMLLDNAQVPYTEHRAAPGYTRFYFTIPNRDKVFGPEWWQASAGQLQVICDEVTHWDGGHTAKGLGVYRTTDKASADFVQYAFVTCGYKTSLNHTGLVWQVLVSARKADHIGIAGRRKDGSQSSNITLVPTTDGHKYCFEVPSSYLILRHNNCVFITGNSTKTTASIIKIAYEASRVAPCPDGIRRSSCAVIRNTNQMLTDAFLPDFFKWFPDGQAGHFERTNRKFMLRFNDVECEVLFRGLDDANDVRRLLSLQLSFGVMDEYREIHRDIFEALTGRLGRYPDKSMNGVGCCDDNGKPIFKVWGATNPPDAESFWEEFMTSPPENAAIFIQPSGLSPDADWLQYLPDNYYENLMKGKSDEWIDVYVRSEFGKSLSGKPVFPTFNRDFHVSKSTLTPYISVNHPLIIGMDFGLTPACTISQLDPRGRFLTFAELTSSNMGITRFLAEKLTPLLKQRFPGHPVIIIGDPAGAQRAQTDERSVFEVIRKAGYQVMPARTNNIAARIAAVEELLGGQIDGGARHLIDPSCRTLIKAFTNGYRYKLRKAGDMDDKPEKNEYSHLSDAHQYAALHTTATAFGVDQRTQRRAIQRISTAGWT